MCSFNSKIIDLRDLSYFDFFEHLKKEIQSKGALLHGSPKVVDSLIPKKANDEKREEGRKIAVYGTEKPHISIFHAILNLDYLISNLSSIKSGYGMDGGNVFRFKLSKNIYDLVLAGDSDVFQDGYIYILDKSTFVKSKDSGGEYYSFSSPKILKVILFSKNIAKEMFVLDGDDKNLISY